MSPQLLRVPLGGRTSRRLHAPGHSSFVWQLLPGSCLPLRAATCPAIKLRLGQTFTRKDANDVFHT